ncbi:hypothetical protein MRX96_029781 [Rhipicephalus microplus]
MRPCRRRDAGKRQLLPPHRRQLTSAALSGGCDHPRRVERQRTAVPGTKTPLELGSSIGTTWRQRCSALVPHSGSLPSSLRHLQHR